MANIVGPNLHFPPIHNSEALFERSNKLIPCNTQTIAKGYTQYVNGVAPKYLMKGKGARVWDVDGNEFIDYNMGIGPISLGYAYPEVDAAIIEQLSRGITFSLVNPLEVELAELLSEMIPNAESVRYSKTGAEVTSAAIRIARAYTGRNKVITCGYHGWHDWYAATLWRNAGIPDEVKKLTQSFNYNDIESLRRLMDSEVAAVILEPVIFEEPLPGFLHEVKKICEEFGALLIFDEMWTGFRIAPGGAQQFFEIKADLATFSKAIANGMPLSVITGRKDVMKVLENDVFFFNTYGGEALSLAAALSTLRIYQTHDVVGYLWRLGTHLKVGMNEILRNHKINYLKIKGYPYRLLLDIEHDEVPPLVIKSYLQQELIRRGLLWSGTFTLSYSHTFDDINYTISAFDEVIRLCQDALQKGDIYNRIKGEIIQPSLRPITNFAATPNKV